jgi:sulfate adenylyltransferase
MIKPVGSDELKPLFVYDPDEHHKLTHEANELPSVIISSQAAGNAVMMGAGYFSPLKGFMNVADAMGAAQKNDPERWQLLSGPRPLPARERRRHW